ncbi:MAG: fibronectin type III domain-containing protein [Thermoplasmata archaeon]
MKRKMFVILTVVSLGFLFVPLPIVEPVVASPVTLFEPTDVRSTSLVLHWTAHPYKEPDPDGNGTCYRDHLEVHISTSANFTPNSSTYRRAAYRYTSTNVYGLTPSTTYYFKIVVVHGSGYGDEPPCSLGSQPSNEVSATTLPSAVYIQSVVSNPDRPWDSVDISWDANKDLVGFEMYVIESAFAANFSDAVTAANITNQATELYTVAGLTPSTAYFFRVTVHAITGKSNPSPPEAVMTEEIPQAVGVTLNTPFGSDISQESVRLSWVPVHDEFCEKYIIERARSPDFIDSVSLTVNSCNITEYEWKGLGAGTRYYFRVISHNTAGNEATSSTVSAVTKSTSPPIVVIAESASPIAEIMIAANTVVLLVILLLLLVPSPRKRFKSNRRK